MKQPWPAVFKNRSELRTYVGLASYGIVKFWQLKERGCLLETGFFIAKGCWFHLLVCLVFWLVSYFIWNILIVQNKSWCCMKITISSWCTEFRLVLSLGRENIVKCTHWNQWWGVIVKIPLRFGCSIKLPCSRTQNFCWHYINSIARIDLHILNWAF